MNEEMTAGLPRGHDRYTQARRGKVVRKWHEEYDVQIR